MVQLIGVFMPWGNTTEIVVSSFGVLLFGGFVMYDIQKIKQYPDSQYIEAALSLYLDIFNLFLYILRLMMAINRK